MKIIAVIQEAEEIRRILAHPGRMAEQHAKRATRLVKIAGHTRAIGAIRAQDRPCEPLETPKNAIRQTAGRRYSPRS